MNPVILPRLYAILDPDQTASRPLAEVCDILLAAGVRLIQYRDKLTRQSKTAAIPSADIGSVQGFQRLQSWGIAWAHPFLSGNDSLFKSFVFFNKGLE